MMAIFRYCYDPVLLLKIERGAGHSAFDDPDHRIVSECATLHRPGISPNTVGNFALFLWITGSQNVARHQLSRQQEIAFRGQSKLVCRTHSAELFLTDAVGVILVSHPYLAPAQIAREFKDVDKTSRANKTILWPWAGNSMYVCR
jgi:hypothetical protein